jgi:hypothetical protein
MILCIAVIHLLAIFHIALRNPKFEIITTDSRMIKSG